MRCLKCNRALTRFAFSVETADGLRGWGSSCARKTGLKHPKVPRVKPEVAQRDTKTIDWVAELCGAPA